MLLEGTSYSKYAEPDAEGIRPVLMTIIYEFSPPFLTIEEAHLVGSDTSLT